MKEIVQCAYLNVAVFYAVLWIRILLDPCSGPLWIRIHTVKYRIN